MPDSPEKLDLRSPDLAAQRREALKSMIPEAFNLDGSLNPDKLRDALGEQVEIERERFGLNWPGKQEAFRLAQKPTTATLRPAPDESVNWDTTENLFIEGDNLEVLKVLQKAYHGKVKLIYIDPPYNTGNDFVYKDDLSEPLSSYLRRTSQANEDGLWTSTNTESSGRFHSDWMSMMTPRLLLARNLLRDDGTIIISIDDNEVANPRKQCDEIFGEENFIATIIWQKMDSPSRKDPDRAVTEFHDYIVVYAKRKEESGLRQKPKSSILDAYSLTLPDGRKARQRQLRKNGKGARRQDRPTMWYKLIAPDKTEVWPIAPEGWEGRWVLSKETWEGRESQGLATWVKRDYGWVPYYIETAPPEPSVPWPTIWTDVDQSRQAKAKFTALMGSEVQFDNPKPVNLLSDLIRLASDSNDLVLDFFAGSGSTADAVLQLNHDVQSTRKFIVVQLPEPIIKGPYKTIADLAKARLRKSIDAIQAASNRNLHDDADNDTDDLGYRVYKLDRSNFTAWNESRPDDSAGLLDRLEQHVESALPGRSEADILWEILIKVGLPPSAKVETFEVNGQACYGVEGRQIVVCLAKAIRLETIEAIANLKPTPTRFYCLDAAFEGDDARKANAAALFRHRTDESGKQLTEFRVV